MSKVTVTKLKAERLKKGLSQQSLAFYAKVGMADVSRIENRRLIPYPSQAERIAAVLGISPSDLQNDAEMVAG